MFELSNDEPNKGRRRYPKMVKYLKSIKVLLLVITEIEMLFFSGIAFGMNSLFPTLSNMTYFCSPYNSTTSTCYQQSQYFGYLFLTTIISYSVVAVPIGIFFDHFGFYKTKIISAIFVFVGCLSYALSSVVNQYLAFVASMFLGFLAQTMLTCNIALSSFFPSIQNKIVSIYSGSFDSSNIMMAFITLGYRGGISILISFLCVAFAGLFLCSIASVLCNIIESIKPSKDSSNNLCLADQLPPDKVQSDQLETEQCTQDIHDKSSLEYLETMVDKKFPTITSVLRSRQYIMQVAYLSCMYFRYALFFAGLNLQLNHLFPGDLATVNTLLINSSYIFVCGVIFSPLPGLAVDLTRQRYRETLRNCDEKHLYDNFLKCFTPTLIFCTSMNVTVSVLILFPYQAAIYSAYVTFMLMRVTLFSTNSSYILLAFPKKFFGKLFGISVLISGALSFILYALLFEDSLKMSFVNYAMIALVAMSYVHPLWLLCIK